MLQHYKYLRYILKHKYYIIVYGTKIGLPLWRALLHDWTKFMPNEWSAYANRSYTKTGESKRALGISTTDDFEYMKMRHRGRNKHHWQAWVQIKSRGRLIPLPIPEVYVKEMVADWASVGHYKYGINDIMEWYKKHRDGMVLHPDTVILLDKLVNDLCEMIGVKNVQ